MKHYFKENGSKFIRMGDDITSNNNPVFTYGNDDIRPYWRNVGTGSEKLIVEAEDDGSFLLRTINESESGKGRKETWLHLDKDTVAHLMQFLHQTAKI